MEASEDNRWIIGETLQSLGDDSCVWVVHNRCPRLIGVFQSHCGRIEFDIRWSEWPLTPELRTRLTHEAARFFLEYNAAAYGMTGPSWSFACR